MTLNIIPIRYETNALSDRLVEFFDGIFYLGPKSYVLKDNQTAWLQADGGVNTLPIITLKIALLALAIAPILRKGGILRGERFKWLDNRAFWIPTGTVCYAKLACATTRSIQFETRDTVFARMCSHSIGPARTIYELLEHALYVAHEHQGHYTTKDPVPWDWAVRFLLHKGKTQVGCSSLEAVWGSVVASNEEYDDPFSSRTLPLKMHTWVTEPTKRGVRTIAAALKQRYPYQKTEDGFVLKPSRTAAFSFPQERHGCHHIGEVMDRIRQRVVDEYGLTAEVFDDYELLDQEVRRISSLMAFDLTANSHVEGSTLFVAPGVGIDITHAAQDYPKSSYCYSDLSDHHLPGVQDEALTLTRYLKTQDKDQLRRSVAAGNGLPGQYNYQLGVLADLVRTRFFQPYMSAIQTEICGLDFIPSRKNVDSLVREQFDVVPPPFIENLCVTTAAVMQRYGQDQANRRFVSMTQGRVMTRFAARHEAHAFVEVDGPTTVRGKILDIRNGKLWLDEEMYPDLAAELNRPLHIYYDHQGANIDPHSKRLIPFGRYSETLPGEPIRIYIASGHAYALRLKH